MAIGAAPRAPYEYAGETPLRDLQVVDLGVIAYAECWDLQNRLAAEVASGAE